MYFFQIMVCTTISLSDPAVLASLPTKPRSPGQGNMHSINEEISLRLTREKILNSLFRHGQKANQEHESWANYKTKTRTFSSRWVWIHQQENIPTWISARFKNSLLMRDTMKKMTNVMLLLNNFCCQKGDFDPKHSGVRVPAPWYTSTTEQSDSYTANELLVSC